MGQIGLIYFKYFVIICNIFWCFLWNQNIIGNLYNKNELLICIFDIDNFLVIFQNFLFEGGDLFIMIVIGVGGLEGVLDEYGKLMYRNRRIVSILNI